MKTKSFFRVWRIVSAILYVLFVADVTCPGPILAGPMNPGDVDVIRLLPDQADIPNVGREKAALNRYPNLDPALVQILEEARQKSPSALVDKAFKLGLTYESGSISVVLTAKSSNDRQFLEDFLRGNGCLISNFENTVYGEISTDHIELLAKEQSLEFAAPQRNFEPLYDFTQSKLAGEGVAATGVARLHEEGFTGKGIKVGVLDMGFERYSELVRVGELPTPAAAKAFTDQGKLEVNGVHGTACAQIIHQMAPDAEIYVALFDGTTGRKIQAVQWLAKQGVQIISNSTGGHWGPKNGLSTLDKFVDRIAASYDILYVNAAGNEADNHWLGKTVDANGNGLVDVAGMKGKDFILIQAGQHGVLRVLVTWDDWGADPARPSSTQDIDLFLFNVNRTKRKLELIAKSTNPQNGRSEPAEFIGWRVQPGGWYAVALKRQSIKRTMTVHLTVSGAAKVHPAVPDGSIGIPATARASLAVGAVNVHNDQLEAFSSQGPTDDGRIKPEISAPDRVFSSAYQGIAPEDRFPGTSAACPHVAGFAALLKSMKPQAATKELRKMLLASVRKKGTNAPNNQYGYGHIDGKAVDIGSRPSPPDHPPSGRSTEEQLHVLDPVWDLLEDQ